MTLSRRRLLQLLPATALGACAEDAVYGPARVEPDADWGGLGDADDTAFPDGIQSGDPLPGRMLLWTRYAGTAAVEVVAAVWTDGGWSERAAEAVEVAEGGFVHHFLAGLPDDAVFAWQFRDADGALSRVGHGRAPAAADSARTVRFGAVSCNHYGGAPFACLSNIAARGPMDFFLWNGDTVYTDSGVTQEQIEGIWSRSYRSEGFRDVMSRTPGLFTWDDHEIKNDWGNPLKGVSAEREALGMSIFYDYTAVSRLEGHPDRLWRSFRFGAVEVFVLDSRSEHDIDAGEYLSPEQFAWLTDGLAASTATWKVVVNSVPFTVLPDAYQIQDILYEHWTGYPVQRQALIDFITDNGVTGVMFVSGDVHHPSLARADAEGPGRALLDFLVGPGGSDPNGFGALLMDDVQWIWSDAVNCATRFELRPEGLGHAMWVTNEDVVIAEVWFDVHGEVLDLQYIPRPP